MSDKDDKILKYDGSDMPLEAYSSHYEVKTYCQNCLEHSAVRVKKGVKRFGLTITCENCGCQINL